MSDEPRGLSRRTLLGGVIITAVAIIPGGARLLGVTGSPGASLEEAAARFRGVIDDPSAAAEIGRAYLDGLSRWPTASELVGQLVPPGSSSAAVRSFEDAALRDSLGARRTADYREGRVVNCKGWLVSATEGRLAALLVVT